MASPPGNLPVLPLKGTNLFPQLVMPLVAGRPRSIAAIEASLATEDKTIVAVAQKDPNLDDPTLDDLFPVGTLAVIKKMGRVENALQIIVQGTQRVTIAPPHDPEAAGDYLRCHVEFIPRPTDWDAKTEALHREIIGQANQILQAVNPQAQAALSQMIEQVKDPLQQVYLLSSLLTLDAHQEQTLLAAPTQAAAMEHMHQYLTYELQVLQVRQDIAHQAETQLGKEQREYLLRKQMRAIQEELGDESSEQADTGELAKQLEGAGLPDNVRPQMERELSRLKRLHPASPYYHVTRSYLELVVDLPWNKLTEDVIDLRQARVILDEDHFDLERVKDRILEYLAVMKLNPTAKAPILCFVGPPGVGKTSLGKSIARSIGREFARMSLGGVHDESELRGHRRTYIGSLPGRIIQAIRNARVRNPLLMLDEVDKLGHDFRGDPAAALLEILDPAQNHEFRDNYLDLPFDLSKIFFIATANTLDPIPGPLLDRMEIIRLSGYTDEEKLHIAKRYLLPRQRQESGLTEDHVTIPDETLRAVIRSYTREAGVRQLERRLGSLYRKVATRFAENGSADPVTIAPPDLAQMLGPAEFLEQQLRARMPAGVAAGLAYTPVGGDILYIEAIMLPTDGELRLTGQLGDVMKESARAARSYISSRWAELDLDKRALNAGVHIHVPTGATPKDGPSAGVTMATALASLYSGHPVRSDIAMTGEITLSGLVLPVGGIKEKVLAAHRAGIRRVILPAQNEKDLIEIPPSVREQIEFHFADTVEDALSVAIPQLATRIAAHA